MHRHLPPSPTPRPLHRTHASQLEQEQLEQAEEAPAMENAENRSNNLQDEEVSGHRLCAC